MFKNDLLSKSVHEQLTAALTLWKEDLLTSGQIKGMVMKLFDLSIPASEERMKPFIHDNDIEKAVDSIRILAANFSESFTDKIKKIISEIYITSW